MRGETTMRRCGDWWNQSSYKQSWKRAWEQHGELRRESRGARIAGVCAGIGRHFGVDPFLVRIAWIASFFVIGPFAIFAYILAVAILPKREREPDTPADQFRTAAGEAFEEFKRGGRRGRRHERRAREEEARAASDRNDTKLEAARDRLRAMEKRVAEMEAYIATREFDLSRKIRDLEK
jgi:phage shock protein C